MKNKQKTLSFSAKFSARVALRSLVAKHWHNRRLSQQRRDANSVDFWSKEIKQNVSAMREIRNF